MGPLDRLDSWLVRLRASNPILGWALTILLLPVALSIGIGFVFALPILVELGSIVAIFFLVLFGMISIIGRYKPEYSAEKLMTGASGNVMMALCVVIGILAISVTVLIFSR